MTFKKSNHKITKCDHHWIAAGLDVATCGDANATGFGPLASKFSCVVVSLATTILSYYFIYLFFHFQRLMRK